jgi:NADP-dependent 3-hydroxy acid dehydrogenase YdfG
MDGSVDRLKAAQAKLGPAASTAELDVTDEDAVRRVFTGIERVDHLITAAAGNLRRGGIIRAVVGLGKPIELLRRLEEPPLTVE